MPAINISTDKLLNYIWSILDSGQHALVSRFAMTGDGGPAALPTRKTTAQPKATISPTVAKLKTFFVANPGGHTLADLVTATGIKPNILGRTLKVNNAFRQDGYMWLLNRGAVDRTLTSGNQQKAA